jgi:1,2-phenylacetyl-CoA epoxidase catalytic subunit
VTAAAAAAAAQMTRLATSHLCGTSINVVQQQQQQQQQQQLQQQRILRCMNKQLQMLHGVLCASLEEELAAHQCASLLRQHARTATLHLVH